MQTLSVLNYNIFYPIYNHNKIESYTIICYILSLIIKLSTMSCVEFQAEACKSISYAFKKCPSGMYAEIKYDGERVQVNYTL